MESFLPSEIGRLIYGYLSECDQQLADLFLNSSSVMEECRISKNRSRRFSAKVQGLSLVDILDQYSILCSLIFNNISSSDCVHRNIVNLLKNVLYSKLDKRNKSLADKLTQEYDDDVSWTEPRATNSINESAFESSSIDKRAPVDTGSAETAMPSSQTDVEKMDTSSNMVVNERQKIDEVAAKVVEIGSPIDTINLLESDAEQVSNAVNSRCAIVQTDLSSIDLTSPCPPNTTDSPKIRNDSVNQTINEPKKSATIISPKTKTESDSLRTKFQPNTLKTASLLEPIPVEAKKTVDPLTPPENPKISRLLDTNVFNNLSINVDSRRESYHTPLKLTKGKHVFGDSLLYIDNNQRRTQHDDKTAPVAQQVPSLNDTKNNAQLTPVRNGQNKDTTPLLKTNIKPSVSVNNTSTDVYKKERRTPKVVLQNKLQERRESPKRKTPRLTPSASDKVPPLKPKSTPVARQLNMKHNPKTPKENTPVSANPSLGFSTTPPNQSTTAMPSLSKLSTVVPPSNHIQPKTPIAKPAEDVIHRLEKPSPELNIESNPKSDTDKPEPWDSKLRRFAKLEEEAKLAAEAASKTTRKCKRDKTCKATEKTGNKRKLEESQNTTKAKRICKNKSRVKVAKDSDENEPAELVANDVQNTPMEHPTQNDTTPEAPVNTKPTLMQWRNLGKTPESKSRVRRKKTPETRPPETSQRLPSLLQQTPEPQRTAHKSLTPRQTPESRFGKDSPNLQCTSETPPSGGKNSSTITDQPSQTPAVAEDINQGDQRVPPISDSNAVISKSRNEATKEACKMELESVCSAVESNPNSPGWTAALEISDEFVLFFQEGTDDVDASLSC